MVLDVHLAILDCHLAGLCVHGADGFIIKAMRSQLLGALLRTRFPTANKVGCDMLCKSGVVIYIFTKKHDWQHPSDGEATLPDPVVTLVNKWAHLGSCDLNPQGFASNILDATDDTTLSVASECNEITLYMQ